MGQRFEWAEVDQFTTIRVATLGERIGDFTVEQQVALVIENDNGGMVVESEAYALRASLRSVLAELDLHVDAAHAEAECAR